MSSNSGRLSPKRIARKPKAGLGPVNLEMARELYAAAAARGLKDAADRLAIIGPPSPPPPAAQPAPTQATLTPPLRPASP